MGKVVLAIILFIVGFRANAQDSVAQSALVYQFKDFSIILTSDIIIDSLLNEHHNTQPPARERVVYVYGKLLRVFLATTREPLQLPVKKVAFVDSLSINDLEVMRTLVVQNLHIPWYDARSSEIIDKNLERELSPLTPGDLSPAKDVFYEIFAFAVIPFDTRAIMFRNKKTKEELVNFRFEIVGPPLRPFMMLVTQGNAEKNNVDSSTQVASRMVEVPDTSRLLRIEDLYETSDLVMYFKKQSTYYSDSSMEYRLLSESDKDTNWIKTGHRLVVSQLTPGNHYKLQVRYELHPTYGQDYTFYVTLKWYQTTQTKIIIAGLLIVAALISGLLIYRRRLNKSRQRREQLSLEIKSIRSQLNPHFIFNALSSIQGLVNKHDIPAANRYLTEFSSLLRESLHNHEKEMVPLITEINLLDTYLKLEQLRFNFRYEISTDGAINKNATEIPNLILQPLVENAVKHGVSALGDKGLIKIDFTKKEHDLLVFITDNGSQFDETKLADGFGLKLTKNRIALLGQTLKEQPIKLTIGRSQDIETIVHLVFTNWV